MNRPNLPTVALALVVMILFGLIIFNQIELSNRLEGIRERTQYMDDEMFYRAETERKLLKQIKQLQELLGVEEPLSAIHDIENDGSYVGGGAA